MTGPLGSDLRTLRSAIPAHCFQPSTALSLAYFAWDCALLAVLYAVAFEFESWPVRVLAPFAIGTVFFSLKVVGHDCGHGSFSRHSLLNSCIGNLTNTLLFVPYHAWRISHGIHHRYAGDIDRDEGWHPLTESQFAQMPRVARNVRLNGVLFVFPLYLWRRTWGRVGSHFDSGSPLFAPADRAQVRSSLRFCALWALVLGGLAVTFGPGAVAYYYVAPYFVFVFWMDLVTYLHHTDPDVPWRRSPAWNFVEGALGTVDRNYGWLAHVHHHIGTHVVHHLFPGIPHYHLREATEAIRPLLGSRYRASKSSIFAAFLRSFRECRVVPDTGGVVRYAPSPTESGSRPSTSR